MNIPNIQIKKILYATDLSENAAHAFAYAVSLANMYSAGITILHVLAEFPGEEFITNMISKDTWEEIKNRHYSEARNQLIGKRRDQAAIKEVLEAFSEKAQDDAQAQTFGTDEILIKNGTPAEVIVDTAQEHNCDLIVMGTYGHGTLTDVLVGSTAKWVIKNSPIPVLVVRLP
ncbi:MAG: universal stress protein [Deltaproteobacteria bacterium]|jgi:nucleotide-binding universal stress UspA family protein|nr:universal stress protein [Deltaproteobacteria bacterium]